MQKCIFYLGDTVTKVTLNIQTKKGLPFGNPYYRGPERIRTAVEAFAELCLATRPQDQ